MTTQLRKAGANWVDGDRFFDREAELQDLRERVRDGTHTLLTAQRRMGKTSLVRELLRQLDNEGDFATIFVDLEAANDPADAVAEIAIRAKIGSEAPGLESRSGFANRLGDVRDRIDELGTARVEGETACRHRRRALGSSQGDQVFAALASSDKAGGIWRSTNCPSSSTAC